MEEEIPVGGLTFLKVFWAWLWRCMLFIFIGDKAVVIVSVLVAGLLGVRDAGTLEDIQIVSSGVFATAVSAIVMLFLMVRGTKKWRLAVIRKKDA